MSKNQRIIDLLYKASKQNTNRFKKEALKRGARAIEGLTYEIKDAKQLRGIAGIGEGIMSRVKEILETGKLSELAEESELDKVIGFSQAKIDKLKEFDILTIEEVREAYDNGEIDLTRAQLLGLKYHESVKDNIPRAEITRIEEFLKVHAKKVDPKLNIIICGSYRRGRKTSNDIDVLLYHDDVKKKEQIEDKKVSNYLKFFVQELEDASFMLDVIDPDFQTFCMGYCQYKLNPIRRIDIRWVPSDSLHSAMLYFTGPYELNTFMRSRADKMGMKLNEYGLWKVKQVKKHEIKMAVPTSTEEDIFKALDMVYLTPEQRESWNKNTKKK